MKEQAPDTFNGFAAMFSKIMKDGALSLREKKLIALGIGVVQRCAPCIRLHVQKSLDAGATRQQLLEAASVAVMMGGGLLTHMSLWLWKLWMHYKHRAILIKNRIPDCQTTC